MELSLTGIILGSIAGLVVTTVVTMIWPKNSLRLLRPLAAAVLGVAAAYLIMRLV